MSLGDYLIIHNDPSFDDLLNISINNGSLSISQDKIKVIYIETLNSWWNIVYESKSKYNTLEITNDNNIYDKIDEEILDVTIGNKTRNVDKLFNQRDSEKTFNTEQYNTTYFKSSFSPSHNDFDNTNNINIFIKNILGLEEFIENPNKLYIEFTEYTPRAKNNYWILGGVTENYRQIINNFNITTQDTTNYSNMKIYTHSMHINNLLDYDKHVFNNSAHESVPVLFRGLLYLDDFSINDINKLQISTYRDAECAEWIFKNNKREIIFKNSDNRYDPSNIIQYYTTEESLRYTNNKLVKWPWPNEINPISGNKDGTPIFNTLQLIIVNNNNFEEIINFNRLNDIYENEIYKINFEVHSNLYNGIRIDSSTNFIICDISQNYVWNPPNNWDILTVNESINLLLNTFDNRTQFYFNESILSGVEYGFFNIEIFLNIKDASSSWLVFKPQYTIYTNFNNEIIIKSFYMSKTSIINGNFIFSNDDIRNYWLSILNTDLSFIDISGLTVISLNTNNNTIDRIKINFGKLDNINNIYNNSDLSGEILYEYYPRKTSTTYFSDICFNYNNLDATIPYEDSNNKQLIKFNTPINTNNDFEVIYILFGQCYIENLISIYGTPNLNNLNIKDKNIILKSVTNNSNSLLYKSKVDTKNSAPSYTKNSYLSFDAPYKADANIKDLLNLNYFINNELNTDTDLYDRIENVTGSVPSLKGDNIERNINDNIIRNVQLQLSDLAQTINYTNDINFWSIGENIRYESNNLCNYINPEYIATNNYQNVINDNAIIEILRLKINNVNFIRFDINTDNPQDRWKGIQFRIKLFTKPGNITSQIKTNLTDSEKESLVYKGNNLYLHENDLNKDNLILYANQFSLTHIYILGYNITSSHSTGNILNKNNKYIPDNVFDNGTSIYIPVTADPWKIEINPIYVANDNKPSRLLNIPKSRPFKYYFDYDSKIFGYVLTSGYLSNATVELLDKTNNNIIISTQTNTLGYYEINTYEISNNYVDINNNINNVYLKAYGGINISVNINNNHILYNDINNFSLMFDNEYSISNLTTVNKYNTSVSMNKFTDALNIPVKYFKIDYLQDTDISNLSNVYSLINIITNLESLFNNAYQNNTLTNEIIINAIINTIENDNIVRYNDNDIFNIINSILINYPDISNSNINNLINNLIVYINTELYTRSLNTDNIINFLSNNEIEDASLSSPGGIQFIYGARDIVINENLNDISLINILITNSNNITTFTLTLDQILEGQYHFKTNNVIKQMPYLYNPPSIVNSHLVRLPHCSINKSGNTLAVGFTRHPGWNRQQYGQVNVYYLNNWNNWVTKGQQIYCGNNFLFDTQAASSSGQGGFVSRSIYPVGNPISINDDGDIIAIGEWNYIYTNDDQDPINPGRVRERTGRITVWKYIKDTWNKIGNFDDFPDFAYSGVTVQLNNTGTILAFTTVEQQGYLPENYPELTNNLDRKDQRGGYVKIYNYSDGEWNLYGNIIYPVDSWQTELQDYFSNASDEIKNIITYGNNQTQYNGFSMAFDRNGEHLAISTPGDLTKYPTDDDWKFKFTDFFGVNPNNQYDWLDKGVLAGNANRYQPGYIRVFKYDLTQKDWIQKGNTIFVNDNKFIKNKRTGRHLSLNGDGNIVAFTIYDSVLKVYVFRYENNIWSMMGLPIIGEIDDVHESSYYSFEHCVELSEDGYTLLCNIDVSTYNSIYLYNNVLTIKKYKFINNNWIFVNEIIPFYNKIQPNNRLRNNYIASFRASRDCNTVMVNFKAGENGSYENGGDSIDSSNNVWGLENYSVNTFIYTNNNEIYNSDNKKYNWNNSIYELQTNSIPLLVIFKNYKCSLAFKVFNNYYIKLTEEFELNKSTNFVKPFSTWPYSIYDISTSTITTSSHDRANNIPIDHSQGTVMGATNNYAQGISILLSGFQFFENPNEINDPCFNKMYFLDDSDEFPMIPIASTIYYSITLSPISLHKINGLKEFNTWKPIILNNTTKSERVFTKVNQTLTEYTGSEEPPISDFYNWTGKIYKLETPSFPLLVHFTNNLTFFFSAMVNNDLYIPITQEFEGSVEKTRFSTNTTWSDPIYNASGELQNTADIFNLFNNDASNGVIGYDNDLGRGISFAINGFDFINDLSNIKFINDNDTYPVIPIAYPYFESELSYNLPSIYFINDMSINTWSQVFLKDTSAVDRVFSIVDSSLVQYDPSIHHLSQGNIISTYDYKEYNHSSDPELNGRSTIRLSKFDFNTSQFTSYPNYFTFKEYVFLKQLSTHNGYKVLLGIEHQDTNNLQEEKIIIYYIDENLPTNISGELIYNSVSISNFPRRYGSRNLQWRSKSNNCVSSETRTMVMIGDGNPSTFIIYFDNDITDWKLLSDLPNSNWYSEVYDATITNGVLEGSGNYKPIELDYDSNNNKWVLTGIHTTTGLQTTLISTDNGAIWQIQQNDDNSNILNFSFNVKVVNDNLTVLSRNSGIWYTTDNINYIQAFPLNPNGVETIISSSGELLNGTIQGIGFDIRASDLKYLPDTPFLIKYFAGFRTPQNWNSFQYVNTMVSIDGMKWFDYQILIDESGNWNSEKNRYQIVEADDDRGYIKFYKNNLARLVYKTNVSYDNLEWTSQVNNDFSDISDNIGVMLNDGYYELKLNTNPRDYIIKIIISNNGETLSFKAEMINTGNFMYDGGKLIAAGRYPWLSRDDRKLVYSYNCLDWFRYYDTNSNWLNNLSGF